MPGSAVGGKNPVLAALQQIMLARSGETREHCCRLAGLSWRLGRKLDLSDGQLADLLLLANLHDIGKIRIDGQILNKAGELTRWEREEIHRHPIFGFQIIRALPDFRHIADEILYHHTLSENSFFSKDKTPETRLRCPNPVFFYCDIKNY